MKLQFVGYTLGILITIIGLAQMIPAMIDWRVGEPNAQIFMLNGVLCIFFGGSLLLANRSHSSEIRMREAFMLTMSSWFVVSFFAALPLAMSDLEMTFTDAFFEAVSGVTTTGSTVITGLDQVSHGVLFWRSLMQWVGGFGIIAFALIMLPFLKVGGMQLLRTETTGHDSKAMPRSAEILFLIVQVYVLLTFLCTLTYYILGMSGFDAINHAMTTVSTGGYSTHDQSYTHFDTAPLQYAGTLFMLLGALPFVLYVRFVFQNRFLFFNDEQVSALLKFLAVVIGFLTIWLWLSSPHTLESAFRNVAFSVVSVITTTGFKVVDYTLWGGFAVFCFLILTYIGACAGSTAGGAKMMRVMIGAKVVGRQFKTLLFPSGTFVLNYQGRRLDDDTVLNVLSFLALYVGANAVVTILLTLTGLDFITALSGAATAIANVGPGVGPIIGPEGNFSTLPDLAKWILSFAMILGRLEILTVLVVLSPTFWRD